MSDNTWKRLRRIQQFEYDGCSHHFSDDIEVKVTRFEDIVADMDKKSAIEIVKMGSDVLKDKFPKLSYCCYGSGYCMADYNTVEKRSSWPSCNESMVHGGNYGASIILIDKAIEVLGGDCDCY